MTTLRSALSKTAIDALNCKKSSIGVSGLGSQKMDKNVQYRRQTPLLNLFYSFRARLMHSALALAMKSLNSMQRTDGTFQLLLLGAGLDMSYEQTLPQVKTYAVDLPEVIQYRHEHNLYLDNTILVEGDLLDMSLVLDVLIAKGMCLHTPTIILIECVLCYLPPDACHQTLTILSTHLSTAFLVTYDPMLHVTSGDGLSVALYQHFASRGAPLLTLHSNIIDYTSALHSGQWYRAGVMSLYQALYVLLDNTQRLLTPSGANATAEPFDEHADLVFLLQRYCLSISSNHDAWYGAAWRSVQERDRSQDTLYAHAPRLPSSFHSCLPCQPNLTAALRCL
jgi:hypothetical protein